MSFCECFNGNAVGYLCSCILGPCTRSTSFARLSAHLTGTACISARQAPPDLPEVLPDTHTTADVQASNATKRIHLTWYMISCCCCYCSFRRSRASPISCISADCCSRAAKSACLEVLRLPLCYCLRVSTFSLS